MEKQFYTVVIEAEENGKDSFIQVYFAWAGDLGEAIHRVVRAAKEKESISNPLATEADPYEYEDFGRDREDITGYPDLEVFVARNRYYYPAEDTFHAPPGIILSCIENDSFDPGDLHPGYTCESGDGGLVTITAVVPGAGLLDTFIALASIMPSIVVSWVTLCAHYENTGTVSMYTHEKLASPAAIERFLKEHTVDILENGHVKFTVYDNEGKTNLVITDHKEIQILTYSDKIRTDVCGLLDSLGLEEDGDLPQIGSHFYHWHYKPVTAEKRAGLTELLEAEGFSFWKEFAEENDV